MRSLGYWLSGFAFGQGFYMLLLEIYRPQPATNFWWLGFVGSLSFFLAALSYFSISWIFVPG